MYTAILAGLYALINLAGNRTQISSLALEFFLMAACDLGGGACSYNKLCHSNFHSSLEHLDDLENIRVSLSNHLFELGVPSSNVVIGPAAAEITDVPCGWWIVS